MTPKRIINTALILTFLNLVFMWVTILTGLYDLETLSANIFIGIAISAIMFLSLKAEEENQLTNKNQRL